MTNSGVPFAFVDRGAVNNFTYFYGVQAVDINSLASGPYSLSSSRILTRSTPNNDSQNPDYASAVQTFVSGDDGVKLDSDAPIPNLDPETGMFDGPMPPTDGMAIELAPSVPRLQGAFEVEALIDSFKADENATACTGGIYAFQSSCAIAYLTVADAPLVLPIWIPNYAGFRGDGFALQPLANVFIPFDEAALESFGIPEGLGSNGLAVATQDDAINFINWEGQQNRRGGASGRAANTLHGGARWFSGTEEVTPDPTAYIKMGHLDEVDSVWAPIHHTAQCNGCAVLPNSGLVQYWGYVLAGLGRAADFRVTWNGGGISVRDVTHNVDVPFSGNVGSSWGFLNDDPDLDGTTSWMDFFCIDNIFQHVEDDLPFGVICPDPVPLYPTATIHSVALNTETDPTTGSTATGFTLVLNAMRFFFVASSTPPDGTVWTLRSYSGSVTAAQGDDTDDPNGYAYQPVYDTGHDATGERPAIIPGLAIKWVSTEATTVVAEWDLSNVHTVPDPYLATSQYDLAPTSKNLMFVNLPPVATIRIYTLTGVLVAQLNHDDSTGGGREVWDVRNWSQQFVASGVYFFHVVTPEGDERVGKFTIVNFAGQN